MNEQLEEQRRKESVESTAILIHSGIFILAAAAMCIARLIALWLDR